MTLTKICGLSVVMGPEFVLYKRKGAKTIKYQVNDGDRVLARMDTKEKGRMYLEALSQGDEIGYSRGLEKAKQV